MATNKLKFRIISVIAALALIVCTTGCTKQNDNNRNVETSNIGTNTEIANITEAFGSGPFAGFIQDTKPDFIDVYTEKDGKYIVSIPWDIIDAFPATERGTETGWMSDNIEFYCGNIDDFLWAVVTAGPVMQSSHVNVATSLDGGLNWEVDSDRCMRDGIVTGVLFISDKIGFITYEDRMYNKPRISCTTDGGVTWDIVEFEIPSGLDSDSYFTTLMPSFDGSCVVCPVKVTGTDGQVRVVNLVSADGGNSWEWVSASDNPGKEDQTPIVDEIASSSSQKIIDYSEYYPPVMPWAESIAVPDFLNEEQQILYRRAATIFPIFNGSPYTIFEFSEKGSGELPDTANLEHCNVTVDGLEYFAFRAVGRFESFNEFKNMMLSVYTEEYCKSQSWNCLDIDGNLWLLDTAKGGAFGYRPDLCPDTFEIISESENEIEFYLIAHYYTTFYPDIEAGEQPYEIIKFPIKMVFTDRGWRVALFNTATLVNESEDHNIEIIYPQNSEQNQNPGEEVNYFQRIEIASTSSPTKKIDEEISYDASTYIVDAVLDINGKELPDTFIFNYGNVSFTCEKAYREEYYIATEICFDKSYYKLPTAIRLEPLDFHFIFSQNAVVLGGTFDRNNESYEYLGKTVWYYITDGKIWQMENVPFKDGVKYNFYSEDGKISYQKTNKDYVIAQQALNLMMEAYTHDEQFYSEKGELVYNGISPEYILGEYYTINDLYLSQDTYLGFDKELYGAKTVGEFYEEIKRFIK